MASNDPLVDFLCKPENVPFVVDVAERFDKVYDALEERFVARLLMGVRAKYSSWPFAADWVCKGFLDAGKSVGNRYAGVSLAPKLPAINCPAFNICVARESRSYQLYYGIEWYGESETEPENFPTEHSRGLTQFLMDNGFDRNRWSLGRKTFRSFPSLKQYLINLNESPESTGLGDGAVNDFAAFVASTAHMVSDLNEQLKQT